MYVCAQHAIVFFLFQPTKNLPALDTLVNSALFAHFRVPYIDYTVVIYVRAFSFFAGATLIYSRCDDEISSFLKSVGINKARERVLAFSFFGGES